MGTVVALQVRLMQLQWPRHNHRYKNKQNLLTSQLPSMVVVVVVVVVVLLLLLLLLPLLLLLLLLFSPSSPPPPSSSSSSSMDGAGGNSAYRTSAFKAVCTLTTHLWFLRSSPEALCARQHERPL
jgi:hypothetical protein